MQVSNRRPLAPPLVLASAGLLLFSCGEPAASTTSGTGGTQAGVGGAGAGATAGVAGTGATVGVGGAGATGSVGGAVGVGGVDSGSGGAGLGGAAGGGAGSAGTAGAGGTVPGSCTFNVTQSLSQAIGTVGIVEWSTDLAGLSSANIEFELADATGRTLVAPVDMSAPGLRTLLLGMKGQRDYVFRIVANGNGVVCSSEDYMLTTGPVANSVPIIDHDIGMPGQEAPGFIVTSAGIGSLGQPGNAAPAFIIDSDGDVVWWADAPASTTRAHMSYEGDAMWMMSLNYPRGTGQMRRVSMDGLEEGSVDGFNNAHHDFTVLPNGGVAAIAYQDDCDGVIARDAGGTFSSIVDNLNTIYQPSGECHANSIHYHPADDSLTISDRFASLYVKVSLAGQLEWQFGGANPMGDHYPGSWNVNHGHHLLDNGNMLFFNNGNMGAQESPVREFSLSASGTTAMQVWDYVTDEASATLGDVQRLPNGNTLVTYSNAGVIHEVNASGQLVQSFSTDSLGYADFRETLYGPPPR